MKTTLAILALLVGLAGWLSPASAEKVYFGDMGNNKILRCNLDGSNLEELVTTGLEAVGGIAVDRGAGKMYWADWPQATSRIQRANLDGTDVQDVLTGLEGPFGVALDVTAGKIYWTEFSAQKIRRANLDGSGSEDLVTTGLTHPNGIALDLSHGKMYWTDGATIYSAKVQRANLDGSNVETLVTTPLMAPQHLALDVAGNKMYWTDLGTDQVYRADLDGSNLEVIISTTLGLPVGIDLDLANGKLYFSDAGGSVAKILRANLDGTNLEEIVSSGIGACYGLALGPDTAECTDAVLDGPWLAIVTGVEPEDYAVYMIFDGQGTIDELGSFNVPDSAGVYIVEPDCDLTGYIWSDGHIPVTGHVYSDTTAEMDAGGGPMPLLKVGDVGALEGCWSGAFVQDSTATTYNVTLQFDALGSIESSSGFVDPVTGKFFFEEGYLAGHLLTGETQSPWEEIMLLNATVLADSAMTGTFALDCSDCPGGTFDLERCPATGVGQAVSVRPSAWLRSYPNPFNPQALIAYAVPAAGRVELRVFDAAGRLIRTLVAANQSAGEHRITWNGRDDRGVSVSSGVYFLRLEAGGALGIDKILLLR